MPSTSLTYATMGFVYLLFFVGFLLFTQRTDPIITTSPTISDVEWAELEGDDSRPALASEVDRLCELAGRKFGLSTREREVTALVVRGRSAQSIADEMDCALNTVKTHMSRVYRKCDVHSREELVCLLEGLKLKDGSSE